MATLDDQIPLKHLPLDVLQRRIEQREWRAAASPAPLPAPNAAGTEVDQLLASVGLRVYVTPVDDVEPLRAELARRLNEGREAARLRSALYRSHRGVGLLEYHGRPSRRGLEGFIAEAGARLRDETGAPPVYLLAPSPVYRNQFTAIYNVYGAAIRGQPLVLATIFGPLKVIESDLVERITLV